MKPQTMKVIQEIERRALKRPIDIDWIITNVLPGAGDRRNRSGAETGYDFLGVTKIEPGENITHVNVPATAATGGDTLYRTIFAAPKDLHVHFLAYNGTTMNFGTARLLKRFLVAELLVSVAKSAAKGGDMLSLTVFSDYSVDLRTPLRYLGNAHTALLSDLVEAQPGKRPVPNGFEAAAALLLNEPRSLVLIASDFQHLGENDVNLLRRLNTKHEVCCVFIQDRRERQLPAGFGFFTLEDMRTGEQKLIFRTPDNRRRYAADWKAHESRILEMLSKARCRGIVLSTEEGDAAAPKILNMLSIRVSVQQEQSPE